MKRAWPLLSIFLLAGCGGCSEKPKPEKAPEAKGAPAPSASAPRAPVPPVTTTSEEIYLGNLDGQIHELERLAKESPSNMSIVQRLSAARHTRARFTGDPDELQRGIDDTNKCIATEPDNAICVLMRAEQEQSLHRFEEARADLEKARKLGADAERIGDLETELDWNDGRYATSIAAIRKARVERPSTATWMREAQLEHDLGNDDASDAAFDEAERLINDTSPFPVAHLELQRGIQNVARGRLEIAVAFFRRAAQRMPSYVAANEHLAETLHTLGKDEEAIAIYERVVRLSSDPEFAHALSELYRGAGAGAGKEARARELATEARKGYDRLLAKYPEAMYWHASEFFSAIGEKKKALELLRKNVVLRPNSTSYVALARAELANGNTAEARKAIDAALAMPLVSASLFWTAQRVYRGAGETAKADAFGERAKKLNPRIDVDEAE